MLRLTRCNPRRHKKICQHYMFAKGGGGNMRRLNPEYALLPFGPAYFPSVWHVKTHAFKYSIFLCISVLMGMELGLWEKTQQENTWKPHNEARNLYSLGRSSVWEGHAARLGRGEKHIWFFFHKSVGKSHFGEHDIDGSVIFKLILTILCADWIELAFVNSTLCGIKGWDLWPA
jgi:hypothetical protein